jgi:hypothetical protein
MKRGCFLAPAAVLLLILNGCGKTGGGKMPTLSLESVNTTVQVNDSMRALIKFINSGATLGNGSFFSIRQRLNQTPATNPTPDTLQMPIPAFSGANSGEFRYALPWVSYLSETAHQNDTDVFKFFAVTSGNVVSDTITSPQIIILNP